MDLQPRNVDNFVILMVILMAILMILMVILMVILMIILMVGLQLVESVERGFGEEKSQIGACESVRVLCDVIAIRCVQ